MQVLLNGLVSGLGIALLAMAFQMVYLPTRVFFIGLAGLFSLAPYVCQTGQCIGLPFAFCFVLAVATVALASVLCEHLNHARLERIGASQGAHLISSMGIYVVIVQLIAIVWGNHTRVLRTSLDFVIPFPGAVVTQSQRFTVTISLALLILAFVILRFSNIGLRLRALADNPSLFALLGQSVTAHRLAAFALSGVFAGASSLLVAHDIGFNPNVGLHAVLLAVVSVIIGGRRTFIGPVVGALLLGVIRAQIAWHISGRWQDAVTFAFLALFLLFRPAGLLGATVRLEAGTQ